MSTHDKVLCLIETHDNDHNKIWDQENFLDYNDVNLIRPAIFEKIMPLFDHPHTDIENGQREVHYHADVRYIDKSKHEQYAQSMRPILPLGPNQRLEYRMLLRMDHYDKYATPVQLISKSKLKHKCIHKGKCPHRGYDLSGEIPVNGVITCPLHGLKFSAGTKELLNDKERTHEISKNISSEV